MLDILQPQLPLFDPNAEPAPRQAVAPAPQNSGALAAAFSPLMQFLTPQNTIDAVTAARAQNGAVADATTGNRVGHAIRGIGNVALGLAQDVGARFNPITAALDKAYNGGGDVVAGIAGQKVTPLSQLPKMDPTAMEDTNGEKPAKAGPRMWTDDEHRSHQLVQALSKMSIHHLAPLLQGAALEPKPVTAKDQAGNLMLALARQSFANTLAQAKTPADQRKAYDAFTEALGRVQAPREAVTRETLGIE